MTPQIHIPGGFSPGDFESRRARVLEALGGDAMVLVASPPQFRNSDSEYAYRPDSSVFYLTGLAEPEVVVVLRGYATDGHYVVFTRSKDAVAEQWSGARLGPDVLRSEMGADEAFPIEEVEQRLSGLLEGAERIHFRLGRGSPVQRQVLKALEFGRTRGTRKGVGPRTVVDPGVILDPLRMRKDARELELIRRAAAVTVQGFSRAARRLSPGMGEWEVQAEMEHQFRRANPGGSPAFASIVASGSNACVLHYVENRRVMAAGDLVLLDAGAEVDMYAGDVSRTLPVSGRFTAEQRAVYEVVALAEQAAVGAVAPGVPVSRVHETALAVLTEGLLELGVLSGDPGELLDREAYKPFYPHQTSHWLGLDVHDVGSYARGGDPVLLEPGMVLTVEPGLYFPPGREGVPDSLSGIGVRLEDDVLVTEEGAENLTGALPLEAGAVEEWLAGSP